MSDDRYELTEKGERFAASLTWPCLSRVDRARLWLARGGWRGVHRSGALPLVSALWHDKPKETP